MQRRRITEEPTSQLALWARRFAIFALAAALLSVVVVRSGLLEIVPALATFAGALVFAGVAILLAIGALVVIWREGHEGVGPAFGALALALALLAYPAYLGMRAFRLPAIADITTDAVDPPRFEAIARLRTRDANPVLYAGLYAAEQQRSAYPDIEPLEVSATSPVAYDAVRAVITKRRWKVILDRRPAPGRRDGQIEAVARTPIMGFSDDVVLRVRPLADGARIDVRSASRYGQHDFGANAARIKSLLEDIEEQVDALIEDKQEKAQKAEKKDKKGKASKGGEPARKARRRVE
jgi:uncharacterized protein (DUF1499 family)